MGRPQTSQISAVDPPACAPLPYRRRAPLVLLAREAGPAWPSPEAADDPGGMPRVLEALHLAVGRTTDLDLDGLSDPDLERLLDELRVPIARLEATRAQGLAALERRAGRRAPTGGATAAELEQRRRNAQRQRMAPSRAKRAAEAGRAAADHVATGHAFRAGDLSEEHVRLIGSLLRRVPLPRRQAVEQQLLELAGTLDPVAFGRKARALLIQEEPEAAARVDQLAEDRRSVTMADTPDGGFAFSGLLHGTAAETARTALHAFRRPDTPDEHRTTEQRTADAFEQLCEAALRLGDAPRNHGVRPHVIVVIDEADLGRPDRVARLGHSGQPLPADGLGHLLDDATVSRLVRDAAGTPIEASESVRTVPVGLWRALLVRDGGCTWEGCDAPASWCDVAHGAVAFRDDGILSPANAALLCRRHHRRFDRGGYRPVIDGDRVRFERTTRRVGPNWLPEHEPSGRAHAAVRNDRPIDLPVAGASETASTARPVHPRSVGTPPASTGPVDPRPTSQPASSARPVHPRSADTNVGPGGKSPPAVPFRPQEPSAPTLFTEAEGSGSDPP